MNPVADASPLALATEASARERGRSDVAGAGDRRVVRLFLFTGTAAAGSFALYYAALILASAAPSASMQTGLAACLLLFLINGALALWPQRVGGAGVLLVPIVATMATAGAIALVSRQGASFIGLAFVPVLLCAASTVLPRPVTWALASAHLLMLVGLALDASQIGLSPAASALPLHDLFAQAALLVASVAIGLLMRRAISRTMARARRREQRFAGLLAVAADWYWEIDAQLRFTHLSEQADGSSALSATRRLGRAPWEIDGFGLDPEMMDAHRADLEARRAFSDLLVSRIGDDGRTRWFSVSGRPRFDDRGVFAGYWGVGRDITVQRETELARQASETRYRELFARSPTALVLHRDGRVIDANDAALKLFGVRKSDELVGHALLDYYDDGDGSRERAAQRVQWLDTLEVGEAVPPQDFALRTVTGRRLKVQVTSVKVEADGGDAVLSIYRDRTEQLAAEAARERSEALLSHVVATSPDLITLTDMATGRYVMVNDAFVALSGYPREEVIGKTSVELNIWGEPEARERFVEVVRNEGSVRDMPVTFLDRGGREFSVLVSAARFVMEGREYLVLNGRDVTRLEHERLEREAILANASIGIALTRERQFQLANPRFEQMFGWGPGELVGQPGSVTSVDQAAYEELGRLYGPALSRGEAVEFERTMRRRDGSTFLCRLLARPIDPTHPAKGATIWIAEDVTERRAVEQALARARDEAEAASRAKSAFLANTSHEIRTPLNGLVGLARLARQAGLPEERRNTYLAQIDDSARSLSGVISDILDLSKIEAGRLVLEATDFDLRALLESIEHGYSALAEARALTLQMSVAAGVPRRVRGDPLRVRQVLTNFLSNAVKFTEHGGVTVRVRAIGDDKLRFEVKDSGPGIDAEAQTRLFQPFMQADTSTTRRYGGTGLGLSICRELAHLMQGEVGVQSRIGEGSLFWAELMLPAADSAGPRSGFGAFDESERPLAGMRLMIVEDNPVNMMIATALLEQWGVEVTQASNGAEAVTSAAVHADAGCPFDLILMDVQMPVLGGHDATRELRQRFDKTQLPIVALTAAALTSERDEALAAGMNDFLTKPIDPQRLHDTLLRWRRVDSAQGE